MSNIAYSEKNMFFETINKPAFKTTINASFPVLSGLLTSLIFYLATKNEKTYIIITSVIFIVLGIIYIAFLVHYNKEEKSNKQLKKQLMRHTSCTLKSVISLCGICRRCAEAFNTFSHTITEESKIDLNIWCFDTMSMQICQSVHDVIKEISSAEDIEVTYSKLFDEKNQKIMTTGFHNSNLICPNVYRKSRSFSNDEKQLYFDARIFNKNNPEIIAFDNPEDISNNFYIDNRSQYNNKYTQYIAVPVICNDNKIIGVLQIVSRNGSTIAKDKSDLEDIAQKYILQFASISLLLSKSEKEMLSIPGLNIFNRRFD